MLRYMQWICDQRELSEFDSDMQLNATAIEFSISNLGIRNQNSRSSSGRARGKRQSSELAGSRSKVGDRFFKIRCFKVRPQLRTEIEFRIGSLPEKEIRKASARPRCG